MNDPVRLLDGDGSALEQQLLRACAREEPPADGPLRVAAALGLSMTSPAAAAASAEAASHSIAPAAGFKLGGAVGWLAGGGVSLGAAALIYTALVAGEPAAVKDAVNGRPAGAREEPTPLQGGAPEVSEAQQARSIAREIAALDRARAALHRGDEAAALEALASYARQHPAGVLRQEATVLRVEALVAAGDADAASDVAQRFLRDNPDSPHGKRMRALIDGERAAP